MPPHEVLTRAYTASVDDVDVEARTIVAKINTQAVDRYRTVILPEGGRFDNYRKNPIVLFNHGNKGGAVASADMLPIGRNLWIKSNKKEIVAKTEFLPLGESDLADKVLKLYDLGYLNAWSISFDPIEGGRPTVEELRRRPELAECQTVFRVWDLLEYSCVTLPGNPEATRQARAAGLELPGWAPDESAGTLPPEYPRAAISPERVPLPPLIGRSFAQVEASVRRALDAELAELRRRAIKDAVEVARGMV